MSATVPLAWSEDYRTVPVFGDDKVEAVVARLCPPEGVFTSESITIWADRYVMLVDIRVGEDFVWPEGPMPACMLNEFPFVHGISEERPLKLYFQAKSAAGGLVEGGRVLVAGPSVCLRGTISEIDQAQRRADAGLLDLREFCDWTYSAFPAWPCAANWIRAVASAFSEGKDPPSISATIEEDLNLSQRASWDQVLKQLKAKIDESDPSDHKVIAKVLRRAEEAFRRKGGKT